MINEKEAKKIINKLFELQKNYNKTKSKKDKNILNNYEKYCISKFEYIIKIKTSKYKNFSNYDDLVQEGLVALTTAFKSYNPKLGSIFWWIHKYVDTRISRHANKHSVVKFPITTPKEKMPYREYIMPDLMDENNCPEKSLKNNEIALEIQKAINTLTEEQKQIINLAYGFDGDKPLSVNKICKKLNISRSICISIINESLNTLRKEINI